MRIRRLALCLYGACDFGREKIRTCVAHRSADLVRPEERHVEEREVHGLSSEHRLADDRRGEYDEREGYERRGECDRVGSEEEEGEYDADASEDEVDAEGESFGDHAERVEAEHSYEGCGYVAFEFFEF